MARSSRGLPPASCTAIVRDKARRCLAPRNSSDEILKTGSEDGVLSFTTIIPCMKKYLADRDLPEPHYGDFGDCDPDGDFLFIMKRK